MDENLRFYENHLPCQTLWFDDHQCVFHLCVHAESQRSCRPTAAGSRAGKSDLRSSIVKPAASRGNSIAGQGWHAPPLLAPTTRITRNILAARNRFGPTSGHGVRRRALRPLSSGTTAALLSTRGPSDNPSGWHRAGRPAWRAGVSREHCFSPSTRWGCSVTGPGGLWSFTPATEMPFGR